MATSPRNLEQIELDYTTAHGQVAQLSLDPSVSDETKMLAAAIVEAGAQIALALISRNGQQPDAGADAG
jgi:hypothetical protein